MEKILLVEDNVMNRELVKDILEMNGYLIECVKNGKEALTILELESFDIVLTDINLPIMDGIELIQKIREKDEQPKKIVAMTADTHTKTGKTFEEAGFDGFVQKPFKIDEFRKYVKSFTDGL